MSDAPKISPIDVGRLQLDAWSQAADVYARVTQAKIAWNTAMGDLLLKRAQYEREVTLVAAMRTAVESYARATHKLEQDWRWQHGRVVQTRSAIRFISWMERGQDLDPDNVRHVWVAFRWLMAQALLGGCDAAVFDAPLAPECCVGSAWCYPRDAQQTCPDVPLDHQTVRRCVEWAASHSYLPAVGSPAMRCLRSVMAVLALHGRKELEQAEAELAVITQELTELRSQSWQTVNYATPPKGQA